MEKLNIKISLANRLYPMNIASSEEKIIRLSAFKIEKMLKVLKDKYSVKDDQDLLAMCALQLCVKLEKSDVHRKEIEEKIIDNIFDINEKISDLV
tara:strand:- start:573 stop:857 length:285 start_codon:yes stop_codon:yes gene_type:complete